MRHERPLNPSEAPSNQKKEKNFHKVGFRIISFFLRQPTKNADFFRRKKIRRLSAAFIQKVMTTTITLYLSFPHCNSNANITYETKPRRKNLKRRRNDICFVFKIMERVLKTWYLLQETRRFGVGSTFPRRKERQTKQNEQGTKNSLWNG